MTDDSNSDYHSKRAEIDTSPDGSRNRGPDKSAQPSTPTKKGSAKPEVLTFKSEVSARTSSEKDGVLDQLKEHLIALARMFLFFHLKRSSEDSHGNRFH